MLEINDLVNYEASYREDLQKAFIDLVEDYLDTLKKLNKLRVQ